MRINIVYAAGFKALPDWRPDQIKNIGPTWGSWKTWQSCVTDNVICDTVYHARELLKRNLQSSCNFYLPERLYLELSRPMGVHLYKGNFLEETHDIEDIVAMHLVSAMSDLVLLLGFDVSKPMPVEDRLEQHRIKNRLGLIRSCILIHPDVQWVLIDHPDPDPAFLDLPNLTRDNMKSVLKLLA